MRRVYHIEISLLSFDEFFLICQIDGIGQCVELKANASMNTKLAAMYYRFILLITMINASELLYSNLLCYSNSDALINASELLIVIQITRIFL